MLFCDAIACRKLKFMKQSPDLRSSLNSYPNSSMMIHYYDILNKRKETIENEKMSRGKLSNNIER